MSQEKFAIDARSCTLISTSTTTDNKAGLLEDQRYVIPVYQRPYRWDEEQVRRLLKGIVSAYLNECEPYFIGTMQLMPKAEKNISYFEIVDGQQRLTTLLLFFKVVQLQYSASLLPESLQSLDWLSTKVNKNEHQEMLEHVLKLQEIPAQVIEEVEINPYLRNLILIRNLMQELVSEEREEQFVVGVDFINYVLHQLYVVVIETRAGLAKTLDIFNTINTAGMDLNSGDVFKVQLFEYLTRIHKYPDSVFHEIDELYADIEKVRKELGDITNINVILEAYKYILIERVGASRTLHDLGVGTFYERLFSCLLLGEKPNHFNKDKMIEALGNAPLNDLKRLVKVNHYWEKNLTTRQRTWHMLLWKTRYGKYWVLDLVYLFKFYDEKNFNVQLFNEWKENLVKYFMVKTIQYRKTVNSARTFTYDVVRTKLNDATTQHHIVEFIKHKVAGYANVHFKNRCLYGDLFDNPTQRYLVFWVLAMLEEPDWDDQSIYNKFFDWQNYKYDIEHIRPRNPEFSTEEDNAAWANHLNNIGNLVLLERDLNRGDGVKHHDFEHKHTHGYAESQLIKITQLREEHSNLVWNPTVCQARAEKEVEKLTNFLFGVSLN